MHDADPFAAAAEAVLRQLAREYTHLNWLYFGDRLRPVPLSLSDDSSRLGCFQREPRRIQLSRALVMERPWGTAIEVLKHEMAHQFVFEVLGHDDEPSHGPAFQRTCERLGIDARATGLPDAGTAKSPILERIKKLLALAGSPNQHEAETAMRTAHRLMLQHNLRYVNADPSEDDYGFRHLGQPSGRTSEAQSLLAGILGEYFFVQPIWISVFRVADQKRASVLEITGRYENLVMAEYVHGFLEHAAESLWSAHKQRHGIERNADRRAFQAGVMRGFAEKLRAERKHEEATGLIWVSDPSSDRYFRRRHPRVRHSSSGRSLDNAAGMHGREAGRGLVLNRPISAGPSKTIRALRG